MKKELLIAIVGHSGVGRQTLAIQCSRGYFCEYNDAGIEDAYTKNVILDNNDNDKNNDSHVLLHLRNQVGYEFVDSWLQGKDAYLVVYSVTEETFEVARDMLRKILYSFNEKSPIMILCANMCDKDGRVITAKEGQNLAAEYNIPYIETSAKTGKNVDNAFIDLAKMYYKNLKHQLNQVLAL